MSLLKKCVFVVFDRFLTIFGNFWTSFLYLWFLYHDFGPPFYICDSYIMLLGNARICNQSKFGYLLGRWAKTFSNFDFLRFLGHVPFEKVCICCFWSFFDNIWELLDLLSVFVIPISWFWTSFLYLWFLYHAPRECPDL